jgi:hypothetical protein
MSTNCILHLIGQCTDQAIKCRYATEEWCASTQLTAEQKATVRDGPLCANHHRHPERVLETEPRMKRRKTAELRELEILIRAPTLVCVAVQTEGTTCSKETQTGATWPCAGLDHPDLAQWIEHHHGCVFLTDEGFLRGEKKKGWSTFRARECTGEARGASSKRCEECQGFFLAASNARSRYNSSEANGTAKFRSFSSMKLSPAVRDLLDRFRKAAAANATSPAPTLARADDDIEIEVHSPLHQVHHAHSCLTSFPFRTSKTTTTWSNSASRCWIPTPGLRTRSPASY